MGIVEVDFEFSPLAMHVFTPVGCFGVDFQVFGIAAQAQAVVVLRVAIWKMAIVVHHHLPVPTDHTKTNKEAKTNKETALH